MKTRIPAGLGVMVAFAVGVMLGQAPAVFEVASIRASPPLTIENIQSGKFHAGTKIDGTHLDFGNVSLWDLLPYAFRAKDYEVVRPEWTRDSKWNILANLPANTGKQQAPDMMRALLTDRFKLTSHHEKREQQVYQLVVAAGGVKVEKGDANTAQHWDGSFPGFGFGGLLRGDSVITGRIVDQPNCGERWEFAPLPMNWFADALTMFLDRPVLDATGLKGDYQVVLDINAETMKALDQNMARSLGLPAPGQGGGGGAKQGPGGTLPPPPPPPPGLAGGLPAGPPAGPPAGAPPPGQGLMQCRLALGDSDGSTAMLFKAVQKLGLELKQTKAPVDMIVVDRLEKTPMEN
jgi:uncharacterized protein (TIGR03435 family)